MGSSTVTLSRPLAAVKAFAAHRLQILRSSIQQDDESGAEVN